MAAGAHKRDPITNEAYFFVEGERLAQICFDIAITHLISFARIFRMACLALSGPEGQNGKNLDLLEELRDIGVEGKRNSDLMKSFALPVAELMKVWAQSRTALLRLAQIFPDRR